MEEKVRAALKDVPDAYDDFADEYCQDLKGDREKQEKVLEYLKANSNV